MQRKGQVVRSQTDYILGTDRRLFRNVTARDPQHNSDHYMVLGCLPSAPLSETKRYLGGRKRWCRARMTWDMQRKVHVVRSQTDYILGTDRRLFRNVSVRDPRHNSDHYMVLGCLPSASLSETKRYLGGRKR